MTEPVTTGQIYWGAVPFVVIQCIMVGLVIAFPAMVMHYKAVGPQVDPSKVKIDIPMPSFQGIPGAPDLNIPSLPPIGGGQPPPIPTPQAPSVPDATPPTTQPRTETPRTPAANVEGPAAAVPNTTAPTTSVPVPSPSNVDIGTPRELRPGGSPEVPTKN